MSRLEEIHEYLINNKGKTLDELKANNDTSSVYLSMEIMEYAHRDQKRVNGEDYATHPTRCLWIYRDFVGIVPDDYFCIDVDLMYENNIPFNGVQEVLLLHDVLEDTDFTIEELEEIFNECDLGRYFRTWVKDALLRITHDKKMDYKEYIAICLENPISALAKMIDMQDNMNVFSLDTLSEENYNRCLKYFAFIGAIDSCYHFIENCNEYRNEYKLERNNNGS